MNNKEVIEDISYELRAEIRTITGEYDTVITDKLEKLLEKHLDEFVSKADILEKVGVVEAQRLKLI